MKHTKEKGAFNMFDNIGGKIKTLAEVVFVLNIIATFILAICAAVFSYELGFLWFLIVMVSGIVLAYVSVLIFYAFGELVENSTIIAKNIEKKSCSKESILDKKTDIKVDAAPKSNLFKSASQPNTWTCLNCGKSNPKTSGFCECGYRKPY